MTEKRVDYRKRQSKKKTKQLFDHVKSAFDDNEQNHEKVDVNPDFQRPEDKRKKYQNKFDYAENLRDANINNIEDKSLRLKKRLNRAILIVLVLIVLVLLALFHL